MPEAQAHLRVRRKRLFVCALVLAVFGGALASYKPVSQFIAVDRCLDSGGRWNYSAEACER